MVIGEWEVIKQLHAITNLLTMAIKEWEVIKQVQYMTLQIS
jgi:hypothetical protein